MLKDPKVQQYITLVDVRQEKKDVLGLFLDSDSQPMDGFGRERIQLPQTISVKSGQQQLSEKLLRLPPIQEFGGSTGAPNGDLQKRCMKCGTTGAHLGQRLKRCARCGRRGLDVYYCVRVFPLLPDLQLIRASRMSFVKRRTGRVTSAYARSCLPGWTKGLYVHISAPGLGSIKPCL